MDGEWFRDLYIILTDHLFLPIITGDVTVWYIYKCILDEENFTGEETDEETNGETALQNKTNEETGRENKTANQKSAGEKILEAIKENPYITQIQLANETGLSYSGVRYVMRQLQKDGILKRIGSTKKDQWIIKV